MTSASATRAPTSSTIYTAVHIGGRAGALRAWRPFPATRRSDPPRRRGARRRAVRADGQQPGLQPGQQQPTHCDNNPLLAAGKTPRERPRRLILFEPIAMPGAAPRIQGCIDEQAAGTADDVAPSTGRPKGQRQTWAHPRTSGSTGVSHRAPQPKPESPEALPCHERRARGPTFAQPSEWEGGAR